MTDFRRPIFAFLMTLSALFVLSPSVFAAEGVSVTSQVDRNQVGLGDLITLQVSVTASDSGNVEPPQVDGAIDGGQVVGSSTGYETRSSYENGRFITQQSRTFTYQVVMNKKGQVQIPPFAVSVDGKEYKTQAIKIAVSDQRRAPPGGRPSARGQNMPDPMDGGDDMEELFQQMLQRHFGGVPGQGGAPGSGGAAGSGGGGFQGVNPQPPVNPNEAFFIQAQVDKTKVVVGEQITASFYLVTRGQIRDIDTLRYPDLKGFWKEDLEMATRLNFENVVVNGIAYQRALLVSYALFPIKAGKATIDQYKAKCTVLTAGSMGFGHPYVFTKASQPIQIDVEDLPSPRPANYTGAVGNFHVTAHFEPPTGSVNQPVTLRVRFEGQGNAKLIEMPKLDLPPSFELYDQKSQAKYLKDGSSFKEFEVLIIPREPGVYKIPPVTIAVFDPKSKKFSEVGSEPLDLSVTGTATTPGQNSGGGPIQSANGLGQANLSKEPQLPALSTTFEETHASDTILVILTLLVYAGALLFLTLFGLRHLRGKPKKLSLKLVLARRLKAARELAAQKEWRRMGVEMTNAAYYILGQLSEQGGAHQELERLLEHTPPSLRSELAEPIQKLLSSCEALSFAPEAVVQDMTDSKRLEQLFTDFNKVLSRAIELADV